MKKLISIIFFLFLWSNISNSFEVGQNVYFNACGSSPTEYFNSPLKIHNILFEAPNKITKLKESKYEREFQTIATSTITEPLFIFFSISLVINFGASAPGIKTPPTNKSHFVNKFSKSALSV